VYDIIIQILTAAGTFRS